MSDRALAERLVRAAGAVALELRGGAAEVKGAPTDVVTEADRRAEAVQLELLRAERPGDGVLGEEGARGRRAASGAGCSIRSTGRSTTRAGCPHGAPRPASRSRGALACAVYDPVAGELFSAARGAGATLGGRPLHVPAAVPALARRGRRHVRRRAPARRRDRAGTERLLRGVGALRADGCGTLELAWVAAGRLTAGSRPTSSRGTGIPAR